MASSSSENQITASNSVDPLTDAPQPPDQHPPPSRSVRISPSSIMASVDPPNYTLRPLPLDRPPGYYSPKESFRASLKFSNHFLSYHEHSSVVYTQPTHQVFIVQTLAQYDALQPNLSIALVSILFCCPLGIAAVYEAMKAKILMNKGEYRRALRASSLARNLALSSYTLGLVLWSFALLVNTAILFARIQPRSNLHSISTGNQSLAH